MKTRYTILFVISLVLAGLIAGTGTNAQSQAPAKVALTPIKALGESETARKLAADVRKALLDKAAGSKDISFAEVPAVSDAKGVRVVLALEITLQGEVALVSVKLLDPASGFPLSGEMVSGSTSNPAGIADRIFEIVVKQVSPASPAGGGQPTSTAPSTSPSQPPSPPVAAPPATAPQPPAPPAAQPPPTPSQPTLPPPAQPSEEATRVRSYGAAVMPVEMGRENLARMGAFTLAKRDAIERALGAQVDLIAVPDEERRTVLSTLQGKVQNVTVITDKRDGNLYVVVIEADVLIPSEVAKKLPQPPPPENTGMPPAVQPFPKGRVNWGEGYLEAIGTGKYTPDGVTAIEMAKRAARVDAYAVALEMVKGINYDPNQIVSEVLGKQQTKMYRIQGLVQGAEVVKSEESKGAYKVTVRVPLWGIKGVTVVFSDLFPKTPTPPSPEQQPPGGEEEKMQKPYTGLVVDARGTGVTPALFPVIVDQDNNVVYSAGMVMSDGLTRRGVAAYSIGAPTGAQGALLGPNPLHITASASIQNKGVEVAALGAGAWGSVFSRRHSGSVPWLLAQAVAKVALRQGDNPAMVKAAEAKGARKAMVVIPNKSAQMVKESAKRSNYLSEARVVVIIDSMVGATEGRNTPLRDRGLLSSTQTRLF